MFDSLINKEIRASLISDIKLELLKFTNLIRKRCIFCSKLQTDLNLFAYEKDGVFYYVCSNCIIKLALNTICEQSDKSSNQGVYLKKKELEAINSYLKSLLDEL